MTTELATTRRLAYMLRPVSRTGHSSAQVLSVYRDFGVIPKDSRDDNFNRTPLDLSSYQLVEPGDLVVNRMKAWQGSLGVSSYRGIVSPDYEVLQVTARDVDKRYLHVLLRSPHLIRQYGLRSSGIRPSQWRLYWEQMREIQITLPPVAQQSEIVNYLDRETARIDALIAKQERLIQVLRERRAAVVVEIMTAMREQWSSDRLGRGSRIGNGSTPRRDRLDFWVSGTLPWLNSAVVNRAEVCDADQFVTDQALNECHLPLVHPGTVLVGLTGQGRTRGMATISRIRATISQHVAYIKPGRDWIPEYLLWTLRSEYSNLRALSDENGSTKGGLTCEDLKGVRVARPPREEQLRVVQFLDKQTAKIDALEAKTEQLVAVAKERRSALITAAVTGQIDVKAVS